MKIAMIAETYLPSIGGAEIHVDNICRSLRKKGETVEIFTNTLAKEKEISEIKIIRQEGNFSPVTIIKNFISIWGFCRDKDIIHSHYTNRLSFLAGLYARLNHKPLVITLHGFGTLDQPDYPFLKRKIHYFLRSLSLRLCHRVISTSNELADVAKGKTAAKKITVIPNGVDAQEFQPFLDVELKQSLGLKDRFVVLALRRLVAKNGVQYLIEALPMILGQIKNLSVIIAGDGPLKVHLMRRARQLKIEGSVQFLGTVKPFLVKNYLSIADVVVFPSAAESTSLACLEAMAMQKAVVASRVGAYPKLINDGRDGILIELFDNANSNYDAPITLEQGRLKTLADAIIQLAYNPALRASLGVNARIKVIGEYDWNIITAGIKNIYKELLGS